MKKNIFLVTSPPFTSVGDQTIVAKDEKGNILTSHPLITEITNNIDSKLKDRHNHHNQPVEPIDSHFQRLNHNDDKTSIGPSESPTTSNPKSLAEEDLEEVKAELNSLPTEVTKSNEWNGVVEGRKCDGLIKVLTASHIDYETVELLINKTKLDSAKKCAELCFATKCGFAYYNPSDKICQFTSNTEDLVDTDSCDVADSRYKSEISEEFPIQITCVACFKKEPNIDVIGRDEGVRENQKTTKLGPVNGQNEKSEFSVDEPVVEKQSRHQEEQKACIINFQLDEEADTTTFEHYDVKKVRSVNDCARICFRGRCSSAVFSPEKGECRLGKEPKETCSHHASVIHYNGSKDVKIQCFRCSNPKNFDLSQLRVQNKMPQSTTIETLHQEDSESTSEDIIAIDQKSNLATTLSPNFKLTTVGLKVGQTTTNENSSDKDKQQQSIPKHCLVKFQARPISQKPAEFDASFELELHVDSIELCATRCYQDGCTGAKYDPKAASCALSYTDKRFCTNDELLIHYKAEEITWIYCVSCYTVKSSTGVGKSSENAKHSLNKEVPKLVEDTNVGAQPNPSTLLSTPLNVGTTTTSKSMSQGDFQRGCVIKFQARPFSRRPENFTAPFEIELPVDSHELCATRCYQDGCSGAKYDPSKGLCALSYNDKQFCTNEAVVLHYKEDEVTWIHCGKKSKNIIPDTVKDSDFPKPVIDMEHTLSKSDSIPLGKHLDANIPATTSPPKNEETFDNVSTIQVLNNRNRTDTGGHFQRGCAIKFQHRAFENRPQQFQSPFEVELAVDSIELCATRCYQDGCSGAKFDPKSMLCSLSYNDKQFCSNDEVVLHYKTEEVTWIHCVNCCELNSGVNQIAILCILIPHQTGNRENNTTQNGALPTINNRSKEEQEQNKKQALVKLNETVDNLLAQKSSNREIAETESTKSQSNEEDNEDDSDNDKAKAEEPTNTDSPLTENSGEQPTEISTAPTQEDNEDGTTTTDTKEDEKDHGHSRRPSNESQGTTSSPVESTTSSSEPNPLTESAETVSSTSQSKEELKSTTSPTKEEELKSTTAPTKEEEKVIASVVNEASGEESTVTVSPSTEGSGEEPSLTSPAPKLEANEDGATTTAAKEDEKDHGHSTTSSNESQSTSSSPVESTTSSSEPKPLTESAETCFLYVTI
uniref:Apple domain-containing protein n=1 Tax=Heterorhabditis bacteriophora TaxID=37862 RepID=A0A1I7XIN2_HETBA